jgi:DNA-binding MarR family transcriptional regulator
LTFYESEDHEIAVRLRHINLLMTKARRHELANLGITPQQVGVMRFIQKFQTPCTIIQLREAMQRSNSSLVAVINRLERKGLVERRADSKSKKYTRVLATETGRKLYKKAVELNVFKNIITSLPREDRRRLKSYIETMVDAAEKTLEEQQNDQGKAKKGKSRRLKIRRVEQIKRSKSQGRKV